MVVRLDPWQLITELRVSNQAEYLVSTAQFYHLTVDDVEDNTHEYEAGEVLPEAPADYTIGWTTQRITRATSTFYNDCAIYDSDGVFIGNTSDADVSKPTFPLTQAFGEFEVGLIASGSLKAQLGSTVDEGGLFTSYKTATDPVGYYSGDIFGASGNFHSGFTGTTTAQEFRQAIHQDSVTQLNLVPTSIVYRGNNYAPIGARASGPFGVGPGTTGYIDLVLSVLFKKV